MPANQVQSEADEAAWSRAKAKVRSEYPSLSEDNDRFWKLTTSIYQNMKGMRKSLLDIPRTVKVAIGRHVQAHALTKSQGARQELALHCVRQYWLAQEAQAVRKSLRVVLCLRKEA